MFVDELLEKNRTFVRGRQARPLPPVDSIPLAVVACYDPRLDPLLRPALGLPEGSGFLFRTQGALVRPEGDALRSLAVATYLFEVRRVLVVGHTSCRMAQFPTQDFIAAVQRRGVEREAFGTQELPDWAGAISSPRAGVAASVEVIRNAPVLPRDLEVAGAVMDDASGQLEIVVEPG